MFPFRADLHCHSTCSDGTFTPIELVQHAHRIGLQGLSITDHDSVEAYETAIPAAREIGLPLIPGVEFSAIHRNASVHILGYAFQLNHPSIQTLCKKHAERRQVRNRTILRNLNQLKIAIDETELLQAFQKPLKYLGRPHIALCMVQKGYVKTTQEAFQHYLAEGAPAYTIGEYISIEETISALHAAKGLAIIAHPHLITPKSLLIELIDMPFDGIECYYARFTEVQCKRWIKIAKKKNWLMTGGSDFHGELKQFIQLGCSFVDEKTFKLLQEHSKRELP